MARGLKYRIKEVEELFYLCCKYKGDDQLRGYREADLRIVFALAKSQFSHDAAHIINSPDSLSEILLCAGCLRAEHTCQKLHKPHF